MSDKEKLDQLPTWAVTFAKALFKRLKDNHFDHNANLSDAVPNIMNAVVERFKVLSIDFTASGLYKLNFELCETQTGRQTFKLHYAGKVALGGDKLKGIDIITGQYGRFLLDVNAIQGKSDYKPVTTGLSIKQELSAIQLMQKALQYVNCPMPGDFRMTLATRIVKNLMHTLSYEDFKNAKVNIDLQYESVGVSGHVTVYGYGSGSMVAVGKDQFKDLYDEAVHSAKKTAHSPHEVLSQKIPDKTLADIEEAKKNQKLSNQVQPAKAKSKFYDLYPHASSLTKKADPFEEHYADDEDDDPYFPDSKAITFDPESGKPEGGWKRHTGKQEIPKNFEGPVEIVPARAKRRLG